jgi:hypothetical protein
MSPEQQSGWAESQAVPTPVHAPPEPGVPPDPMAPPLPAAPATERPPAPALDLPPGPVPPALDLPPGPVPPAVAPPRAAEPPCEELAPVPPPEPDCVPASPGAPAFALDPASPPSSAPPDPCVSPGEPELHAALKTSAGSGTKRIHRTAANSAMALNAGRARAPFMRGRRRKGKNCPPIRAGDRVVIRPCAKRTMTLKYLIMAMLGKAQKHGTAMINAPSGIPLTTPSFPTGARCGNRWRPSQY